MGAICTQLHGRSNAREYYEDAANVVHSANVVREPLSSVAARTIARSLYNLALVHNIEGRICEAIGCAEAAIQFGILESSSKIFFNASWCLSNNSTLKTETQKTFRSIQRKCVLNVAQIMQQDSCSPKRSDIHVEDHGSISNSIEIVREEFSRNFPPQFINCEDNEEGSNLNIDNMGIRWR